MMLQRTKWLKMEMGHRQPILAIRVSTGARSQRSEQYILQRWVFSLKDIRHSNHSLYCLNKLVHPINSTEQDQEKQLNRFITPTASDKLHKLTPIEKSQDRNS